MESHWVRSNKVCLHGACHALSYFSCRWQHGPCPSGLKFQTGGMSTLRRCPHSKWFAFGVRTWFWKIKREITTLGSSAERVRCLLNDLPRWPVFKLSEEHFTRCRFTKRYYTNAKKSHGVLSTASWFLAKRSVVILWIPRERIIWFPPITNDVKKLTREGHAMVATFSRASRVTSRGSRALCVCFVLIIQQ